MNTSNIHENNILLETHRAVYFFIPKVACTSLKTFCADLLNISDGGPVHDLPFPFIRREEAKTAYSNYLKFCFVRNPWDRLVSCYSNKIREKGYTDRWFKDGVISIFWQYGELFYGGMPFCEFVESVGKIPDHAAEAHLRSQHSSVADSECRLLVDFVGRFEHLQTDFEILCDKMSLQRHVLPHVKKTDHRPYREYYTRKTRMIVEERFATDIALFNYSF